MNSEKKNSNKHEYSVSKGQSQGQSQDRSQGRKIRGERVIMIMIRMGMTEKGSTGIMKKKMEEAYRSHDMMTMTKMI